LRRRYTVVEAAKVLGVGTDAVRKRVARGTVEHEKVDNTVYVWLDSGPDGGTTKRHDGGTNGGGRESLEAYKGQLAACKDQVDYLRSSLDEEREARRRADTIIAQLTQANAALAARIPELEAPVEPTPSAPSGGAREAAEPRSWWREFFGF
jgi:hypothetical protein